MVERNWSLFALVIIAAASLLFLLLLFLKLSEVRENFATWEKEKKQLIDEFDALEAKNTELETQFVRLMKEEKRIFIDHATSGAVYQNAISDYGPHNLFDGSLDTDICFISANKNGERWVALHLLEIYSIERVEILNRKLDDYYQMLDGATVEVCHGETLKGCQSFGTVKNAPNGGWAVLKPPTINGIEGNAVKISLESKYVMMCEVRIFGRYTSTIFETK